MRKSIIYLAIAVMALGVSLASQAAGDKEVTIRGEVVDQPCYAGKGEKGRGEAHRACATACAKRGNQLAVVEDGTNAVYSIKGDYAANKNEKLVEFVAETVEVKGTVSEENGQKQINVSSIKKVEKK